MADDEDELTIVHLVGIPCILNRSVKVEIRENTKEGRLELGDERSRCFVIKKVTDVLKDGSYIVTLLKPNGDLVTDNAQIISSALFVK